MGKLTAADYEKQKQDLLARTKESYDRKDGETGSNIFDTQWDIPLYRPGVTKGKPHILDIIAFKAGPNFPTKVSKPVKEGDWAYVLDLSVHKKVGPGKMTVVCPARNYGNKCPICEEVEEQARQGLEYEDIPFAAKRQCAYNVLVMDDSSTEEKGVQVWYVSHRYSEKVIAALAIDARTGGYIPFAAADHNFGRSLAFDVENNKYKTISGHRFEPRSYDIPPEILEEAFILDSLLKIYTYEELCKILYGEEGKPAGASSGNAEKTTEPGEPAPRRSLRTANAGAPGQSEAVGAPAAGPTRTLKTSPQEKKEACPVGGVWADDHDKFEECKACEKFQACAEALDLKDLNASKGKTDPPQAAAVQEPVPAAAPAGGKRLLLRRKS